MTTTQTTLVPQATASLAPAKTDSPLQEPGTSAPGVHASCLRELISPALFDRLTFRVAADEDYDRDTAERIVEQALAFLVACGHYPDGHLSPSQTVDAGWHAFLLHTADYAEFCQRVAGRFIHHRPNGPDEAPSEQQAIGATIAAIRDVGLPVDSGLWVPKATCSQCYQGCADDPKGA
jgi:hypothetical protein